MTVVLYFFFFFFFNDTATTEIYTLSLHDALPISYRRPGTESGTGPGRSKTGGPRNSVLSGILRSQRRPAQSMRSEEHTSELQSHSDLVCRLLLEKKKKIKEIPKLMHHQEHQ